VLSNNFENFAQVWVRLYGNGDYEVRASGTNGPAVSGHVFMPGFTPVKLVYDPVSRRISGFVDDQRFTDFTNATPADIRFVGLEANTGDPTFFAHANWFRVTRQSVAPATARLTIERSGSEVLVRWPTNADGYVLQHRSSFNTPTLWTNLWVTNAVNGKVTLTNTAPGESGYFRLREL
jgi:hypothetical protein